MKFMFFNANGYYKRKEDILLFIKEEGIDIAIIVETHLTDQCQIGFSFLDVPSNKSRGLNGRGARVGGITAFSSGPLNTKMKILKISADNYWSILELGECIVGVGYFPPSATFTASYTEMYNQMQIFSDNWSQKFCC